MLASHTHHWKRMFPTRTAKTTKQLTFFENLSLMIWPKERLDTLVILAEASWENVGG